MCQSGLDHPLICLSTTAASGNISTVRPSSETFVQLSCCFCLCPQSLALPISLPPGDPLAQCLTLCWALNTVSALLGWIRINAPSLLGTRLSSQEYAALHGTEGGPRLPQGSPAPTITFTSLVSASQMISCKTGIELGLSARLLTHRDTTLLSIVDTLYFGFWEMFPC